MPKPAAEFSPLAMMRSIECSRTSPRNRSFTMLRPALPKMSPIKRIRIMRSRIFDGNTGKIGGLALVVFGSLVISKWFVTCEIIGDLASDGTPPLA